MSAPSSILPLALSVASASKGWSNQLKRLKRKEEDQDARSSPVSAIALSTKVPEQSQIASNIWEDQNKVTTNFDPPTLSAFLEYMDIEPVANKLFNQKKDNNFDANFDQPLVESLLALAPEPLPLLLPPSKKFLSLLSSSSDLIEVLSRKVVLIKAFPRNVPILNIVPHMESTLGPNYNIKSNNCHPQINKLLD